MNTVFTIGELESFLIAILVLFIGHTVNRYVPLLKKYNIPEPIVGGLLIAALITVLHFNNITVAFSLSMQNTLMLMFFSTVGLAANYKLLLKGGSKVFQFLGVGHMVTVIQNIVGISL
ncbi:sodium/glutamate symporter, partial [Psychrobacter sp. 1Y1]|uniref:sodium/glutamate symporter n=1 Tax=Psychrobacter sp. 1Y1 TaxID=3453574 RepID=UPI003F483C19